MIILIIKTSYLKKNVTHSYCMLLVNRKKVTSIADLFGSYRINDQGEITFIYKGILLKDLD